MVLSSAKYHFLFSSLVDKQPYIAYTMLEAVLYAFAGELDSGHRI